jgi:hypothetical protein
MHNEGTFAGLKIIQSGKIVAIPELDFEEYFHLMTEAEDYLIALLHGARFEYAKNHVRPRIAALARAIDKLAVDPNYYFADSGVPLSNPRTSTKKIKKTTKLSNLKNAWLAPTGAFYPVPVNRHSEVARKLGYEELQLELAGWLKLRQGAWHIGLKMLRPSKAQLRSILDWQLSNNISDKQLTRQSPDLCAVLHRHQLALNPAQIIRPGPDFFPKKAMIRSIQKAFQKETGIWLTEPELLEFMRKDEVMKRRRMMRMVK